MEISDILDEHYPGKQYTLHGDNYADLEWLDQSTKPTEEDLLALWDNVRALNECHANRRKSLADGGYGTVIERLDMIGEEGITFYKNHMATVNANFPEPEGV